MVNCVIFFTIIHPMISLGKNYYKRIDYLLTMKKGSRLSFRISSKLDGTIEKAILQSQGEIRDRSEFGLKSVIYFLNYLAHTKSEEHVLMAAILKLAESKSIKTDDIDEISTVFQDKLQMIKEIDVKSEHPKFSELLTIIDNLPSKAQETYINRLDEVEFDQIEDLYKEVREKYYLEGKDPLIIEDEIEKDVVIKQK